MPPPCRARFVHGPRLRPRPLRSVQATSTGLAEDTVVSLRTLTRSQQDVPPSSSLRELAGIVGLTHDVSMNAAVRALAQPISFHADITTPSGTALGGTADLTVARDGGYTFDVHLHDSGFDPYDFKVRAAVRAPNGLTLVFQCSGHTDGTGSDLFGSPNRDFDHHEQSVHALIASFWLDVRRGSVDISKSYEDSGVLSVAEDIAKDLLGFLVADLTLGAGLALVIACSAELSDAFDGNFAGPGGLVGVLVAGGIAWVWGPSAILASVAGGVAAGAITDALIDHRTLTEDEYRYAQVVFGDTLPPRERIYVTNLSHDGGRAYTWPNVDHSVLLNLDLAYADPLRWTSNRYPEPGQVLIHELTHAWQIRTGDFTPGLICDRETKTSSYTPDPALAWGDLGLEQQAATVDEWFGAYAGGAATVADLAKNLGSTDAISDGSFHYIADHVRLGLS